MYINRVSLFDQSVYAFSLFHLHIVSLVYLKDGVMLASLKPKKEKLGSVAEKRSLKMISILEK